MSIPQFVPTADNMYVITYPERTVKEYDFQNLLSQAERCERDGDVEKACNIRYNGVKRVIELLPDEDEIILDWDVKENQTVLELLHSSAVDHFLVGDFDMAAGLMEMTLDMDPEDHLETTKLLAYCYVALEEYELFDEIVNDISDKYPEKEILKMWSEYRQTNVIPAGELIYFERNFPVFYAEFTAAEHGVSPEYLSDIKSEHPSREAQARELWLQTEHLWAQFPGFIEALRAR